MNCPLCETPLTAKIDEQYYDCNSCRAIVKDRKHYVSPEEEKALYLRHNNDVHDVRYQNFTAPITNFVLENLSPTQQGLDFGSGTGPVISKMLQDNNYQIEQYDSFFKDEPRLLKKLYDYIASCEVFEHFHHPQSELDMLSKLLKPGGRLLIMTLLYRDTIDFSKWFYRRDPTHVFIYRKQTIEYIAREWHFGIEEMTERFISLKKLPQ